MLPDRSKRYAVIDGEIPRLTLASNWQLLMIALLVLALLTLIFPRRALVDQLYEQDFLDELTISYIQNLYRSDESNADIAILLARSQQNRMEFDALESIAFPLIKSDEPRHVEAARVMLVNAYERVLAAGTTETTKAKLRARFTELRSTFELDEISPQLARKLAFIAFELQLTPVGLALLGRAENGSIPTALEKYGDKALGKGSHDVAAEFYLAAQDVANDAGEARRFFQAGINAYMAASHFSQALAAADRHLGNLSNDPVTLRYLARTSLAAGSPDRAAKYARMLVFRAENSGPARSPAEGSGNSTLIPFNQEDYLLAYEVFVGSGDLEQAYRVAEKAARQVSPDSGWQKRLATVAAWTQRQDVAAEYYFLARQQTSDRDEARRLFLAGMDALMAGSRFKQAMEAADRYLGDLSNDRATLRHLAPIALAAGEPARAASYIDKLVFRPKGTQGKP